ncbi:arginine transporter [Octadecabacter sp. 1_MG-2023]|uniref:arginine transporter n=1 Tax=unclassified Octadecabacter TaxID=196158 RepID=UPI001C091B42|nr:MULTISPECIES: arginine transporter [unclassified Octadecabacter]MBU2994703.1 arginine transporter [Octadecabacter sp. B2R22]MDO6734003.1 arginine transporter [Octadecabacter sp. 1_MG-2023]
MRVILAMTCILALTACGGTRNTGSTRGATGDISRACLAADRSAATTSLCSCVQRVANAELSSSDRSRVARFFGDPEFAHSIRISDTTANDAFWRRYQSYVSKARSQCG